MSTKASTERARGRPRCEKSQARILATTVELLETSGWSSLTIEAIAARAKVSKQTIYKWWSGRSELVVDAYLSTIQPHTIRPDTGDTKEDLRLYLERASQILTTTHAGRTLAFILAEAQDDEGLAEQFRRRFLSIRRDALRVTLQRGIARGELRANLDVELVMDLFFGVFWFRLLGRTAPLDTLFVEDLIALIWPSITATSPSRRN